MSKSKLTLNDFFIQGAKESSLFRAFQRNPESFREIYDVDEELVNKVHEKMSLIEKISTDSPGELAGFRNEFGTSSSMAAFADTFGDRFTDAGKGFKDSFRDTGDHKDVFRDRHSDNSDA